jgi:hypothetical protein
VINKTDGAKLVRGAAVGARCGGRIGKTAHGREG